MERKTFREAYGVLQEHARTLREQTEPNIDDLLRVVTESVDAYKVCKERIDAVEKALREALTDVADTQGEGASPPAGAAPKPRPSASDDDDDCPY